MKERKRTQGRIFYIAGAIAFALFFSSCNTPPSGFWEYEFTNKTSYTITIYLDQEFQLMPGTKDGTEPPTYTSVRVFANESRTIYVDSGSVGFEWSTGTAADRSIAPEIQGSKVTFNARTQ